MAIVALLVSLILIALISLSVFGGGQIFMPIFTWLWNSLSSWFGTPISNEQISAIFAISNSTPGILSPKFATLTGYLIAQGQWWGYIAMFLTYLAFVVPAILMMQLALKYTDKFQESNYLKKLIRFMNPVVTGIIFALAIQLFIGLIAPNVIFNKSANEYLGFKTSGASVEFLVGYRRIILWVYVPVAIMINLWLYLKKVPLFALILSNVVLAILIFHPWV
ncbi:chromate transporter [Mycoplasmopsis mucosicanis]|uniref:Chromate transporter n=1 Tax=Mycoplasmopsis mucosicanis TaxID=458208 RepID=A0A507SMX8_9BACT|nr:chromate transporter [Mycoplasmopsis mucosicanis]TQC51575.1 chromate transporter [Mycoplasmopsis mucosicanis]